MNRSAFFHHSFWIFLDEELLCTLLFKSVCTPKFFFSERYDRCIFLTSLDTQEAFSKDEERNENS